LSVCIDNIVGRDERDLLFLEIREPNPHLQEPWYNSYLTEDDLKPKLRHWLDSHQIGQMLVHAPVQENAVVSPLSHRWPLVLERVNGLFRPQIGQQMVLHAPAKQENPVISPLFHRWPIVVERVNGLFQVPEATEESRRANAIYHLLKSSQPTGTLLSTLVSEGRLGNEGE
jgi:hypothetical protein